MSTPLSAKIKNRWREMAQDVLPKSVYESCVSHKRDVLFYWVPKAAGTSVYNVLLKYGCPKHRWTRPEKPFRNKGFMTFGHVHMPDLVAAGIVREDYLRQAFKFAFVRNPFDRLVSLYFHHRKIKSPDVPDSMPFREFCRVVTTEKLDPVGLYNYRGLNRCNPQACWIVGDDGKLVVDYLGRYETLAEDFKKICDQIGIRREDLPHENKTEHKPYRDYYDDTSRDAVARFYQRDLEMFGYSF